MELVKRLGIVAASALLALGGVAACTALLGIDKDYRVGDVAETGTDAGPDAPDADMGDTALPDAPLSEGSSPCEQGHTFCDDFDKNTLGFGWTGTTVGPNSKMLLDTTGFVSPPRGLWSESMTVPDAAALVDYEALLQRMILGKYKSAVLEADVRIDAMPSDTSKTVELLQITFVAQTGNPNWHFALHHYASSLQIVESHFGFGDGGYDWYYNDLPQALTVGSWAHVRMEVVIGAKTHGKLVVDGVALFDQDLIDAWGVDSKVEIKLGTYALWWGPDRWKAHFDNVVVDVQ